MNIYLSDMDMNIVRNALKEYCGSGNDLYKLFVCATSVHLRDNTDVPAMIKIDEVNKK